MINEFKKFPKVELHVHLDCCLSFDALKKISSEISLSTYKEKFIGTGSNSLKDYIKCADIALEYMQTKQQLEIVVEDLFNQFKSDNIIYAEVRFAPLLHLKKGLSVEKVVKIVSEKTFIESKKSGIEVGLILCTLRHFNQKESLRTAELFNSFSNKNIVGFDLAADEAGYPLGNHIKAFQIARNNNVLCTAHAGEALGSQSVLDTLQHLKPQRIGHGVRCIESDELMEKIKKENIHLEICVTSNIVTKVFNNAKDHPIDKLYKYGISLSIITTPIPVSIPLITDEGK